MSALSALYKSTNGDSWRWRNESVAGPVWNLTQDSTGRSGPKNSEHSFTSVSFASVISANNPGFKIFLVLGFTKSFPIVKNQVTKEYSDIKQ